MIYNPNRLEWHLGDESRCRTPQFAVVGLDKHQARLLPTFNRLVAAHAKSQDPPERIEGFLLLQTVLRTIARLEPEGAEEKGSRYDFGLGGSS